VGVALYVLNLRLKFIEESKIAEAIGIRQQTIRDNYYNKRIHERVIEYLPENLLSDEERI